MKDYMSDYLRAKRIALYTLGCKVNSYESDAIADSLIQSGAELVDFEAAGEKLPDIYIVNTCSVTNIADHKSRQILHRARAMNPNALIVATGCYSQMSGEKVITDKNADIVIGNDRKSEIVSIIEEYYKSGESLFCSPMTHVKDYDDMSVCDCEDRTRAFIKIEDGCNQFCSYCIIPYARGRVRSRKRELILEEIGNLAKAGFKEVVLTGIHISSYGLENYERTQTDFDYRPLLSLVTDIAQIEGIERIRLGSLEPRIISREFAQKLAEITKFCPHFHLSLQSGSDEVLKSMHRRYTTQEYADKCRILREAFDRPSINTDIITGFPGETEEQFEETLRFTEEIGFAKIHIFKYSRRKGTLADRMKNQLTDAVKAERSRRLSSVDERKHLEYVSSFIGETCEILVEKTVNENGKTYCYGLTERYFEVMAEIGPEDNAEVNSLVRVKLLGISDNGCVSGIVL